MNNQTYSYAGMFTTALRWIAGWTYFSAFWRRLILENKLNHDEAGYIGEKFNHFLPNASKKWFGFLGSGLLPVKETFLDKAVLIGSVCIIGLILFTNQYFHGGVYGKLHNLSVRPHITVNNAKIENGILSFSVFRDEGADVYGSFLIDIKLFDENENVVFEQTQIQLSQLSSKQIQNDYVAKVKTGKHSLILLLGARATLSFQNDTFSHLKGKYRLRLLDIIGIKWDVGIFIK